jgi:ribonuclease HII
VKEGIILGIDESGRGPVIGDMVISGVALPSEETGAVLADRGVKDSKLLTRKRRESLYPLIQRMSSLVITKIVSPQEVDSWRSSGMSLNELEAKVFAEIILEARPREAIVDCSDVVPETFAGRLAKYLGKAAPAKLVCQHYADRDFPVVSAASIVAKVTRDRRMLDLCETFGELGSGYCHDARTIQFLSSWYESKGSFPPIVRKSWITASRIVEERSQTRLL